MGIGEWQRALEKAGGIKQRDNPTLLRKALKKKEKAKKKSAKEWGRAREDGREEYAGEAGEAEDEPCRAEDEE